MKITQMMRDLVPMIMVQTVVLTMITYWSGLVMWLPGLLK